MTTRQLLWVERERTYYLSRHPDAKNFRLYPKQFSEDPKDPPLQGDSRFIRQSSESTSPQVLLMEGGPQVPGQCFRFKLGPNKKLAQPTLGHNPPSTEEINTGPGHCPVLSPSVAECPLVVPHFKISSHSTNNFPRRSTVHRPRRNTHAIPQMVNPFLRAGRKKVPDLRLCLRKLENLHDISVQQRIGWLTRALQQYPQQQGLIKTTIKRLKAAAKNSKYPIFPQQP